MKKETTLLLVFFTFVSLVAFGQPRFFVQAGANYSMIPTLEQTGESGYYEYTRRESYENKPGFSISGGLEQNIGKRFSLRAGLGLLNLNYRKNLEYESDQITDPYHDNVYLQGGEVYGGIRPGSPFGTVGTGPISDLPEGVIVDGVYDYSALNYSSNTPRSRANLYYLTFPLGINYHLARDHFIVGLGITPAVLAGSVQQGLYDNDDYQGEKNTSGEGLKYFNFSGNLNLSLRLSDRFWITASFHQGITPMYEEEYRYVGKSKTRYLEAGLKYFIFSESKD